MRRVEHLAEGVTLYLGDSREIVPTLASIDGVVSDPPYGISYQHSGGGALTPTSHAGGKVSRNLSPIVGDDRPFDPAFLLHWPCVLFGATHYSRELPHGTFHVWDKHCGSKSDDSFSDVEFIWSSERTKSRIVRHLWKGVLRDSEQTARREHPSQKPVEVMRWAIRLVPPPATRILDPFMGSGSTGVAAVNLGRKFIGIEIEAKYFEIACRRVAEEISRPSLFADTSLAAAPEQRGLDL